MKFLSRKFVNGISTFSSSRVLVNNPIQNIFICKRHYSEENVNPFSKTFKLISDDFLDIKNKVLNKPITEKPETIPSHCDVLIVGGGVIGSSIAYWLKQRALDGLNVVVVEKDPTVIAQNPDSFKYRDSTSVLSVGGLRQQFSLKENIELSLHSADFLRNIKHHLNVEDGDDPEIQFNPGGYLFLATDTSAQVLVENNQLQTSLGAKVELLTPEKIKNKFPWINTDGIALGSLGLENEGWFDPWSLLFAFKRKAVSLGTHYVAGEVTGFTFVQGDVSSEDGSGVKQLEKALIKLPSGEEISIKCAIGIIAAGPFSGEIAKLAGIGNEGGVLRMPLPIEPRKRFVYNIHCPDGPGLNSPLLIDPSGTYFRREGVLGHYLCGRSPLDEEEPPVDNLDVDYNFFETHVWPVLAHRVPAFNNAKLKSAWAGYYDYNSFDENAFLGPHPSFFNLYIASGFSGHGIQQSPAVGRAVMEMIIDGEFVTIDLSRLGFSRYLEREPLYESNIV